MKKEYAFLLDTGSSWQLENKESEDIYVLPVIINEEKDNNFYSFSDGIDITREELYKKLDEKNNKISTAQPNKQLVISKIDELLEKYEKLIILPISMDLSGFWQSLKNLEKLYNGKLIILNSKTMGIDGNWIIEDLRDKLNKKTISLNSDELNKWLETRYKRVCGTLIVNDLDQLTKGGRVKKTKALLAKAFRIKISIKFQGDLNYFSNDLSFEGAISKSLKEIDKNNHFMTKGIKRISIMNDLKRHDVGEKLKRMILLKTKKQFSEDSLLPGSIICHTGCDTFSILIESNE